METAITNSNELSVKANAPTKGELLNRAKEAIAEGDQLLRDAAEALAMAQELHSTSQAEMARAVGKSEAWVSYLLQWRREDYKSDSPFGPKTKAGRLKHAEGRGASKPRKARKPKIAQDNGADDRETSGPVPATAISTGPKGATPRKPSPEEAKGNLRYAIDQWWKYMDDAGKAEITGYFCKKAGVEVS